jgi:hypothetical protein
MPWSVFKRVIKWHNRAELIHSSSLLVVLPKQQNHRLSRESLKMERRRRPKPQRKTPKPQNIAFLEMEIGIEYYWYAVNFSHFFIVDNWPISIFVKILIWNKKNCLYAFSLKIAASMPKSPAAGWIVYSIEKWEKSDCI